MSTNTIESGANERPEPFTELKRPARRDYRGAWFADRDVTVRRVRFDHRQTARSRFHRTLADGWSSKFLSLRGRTTPSAANMNPRVQPPPVPLSDRQGRTHHEVGQPGWTSLLPRETGGAS